MSLRDRDKSGWLHAWLTPLDDNATPLWRSGRAQILILGLFLIGLFVVNLFLDAHHRWMDLAAILSVVLLLWLVWRELLQPLIRLSDWADSMRAVDLDAQVEFRANSDFSELARDINMLGNMIDHLSRETEAQLEEHTDYISREARSLAILYDVASHINLARDPAELYNTSLESLCSNLNAHAAIMRLVGGPNQHAIAASVGNLNPTFLASVDRFLPQASADTQIQRNESLKYATVFAEPTDREEHTHILSIPVRYRDANTGVIHLIFGDEIDLGVDDYHELLLSIGQHLGTAVEKFRLLEEEAELLVMQERTHLSHELHDSLAQTIAGLRIQLRVIDDSVDTDNLDFQTELKNIEYALDQANNQIRELIANFRVSMNQQDLIASIEDALHRCGTESGISTHIQNEWQTRDMPDETELNVLRIVQEALANVRKHSQAGQVRLHLTQRNGIHNILIEDDGVGFDETEINPSPGRHLGLNILKDRAQQINGNITIDSEPGEGTRISLQFNPDGQE